MSSKFTSENKSYLSLGFLLIALFILVIDIANTIIYTYPLEWIHWSLFPWNIIRFAITFIAEFYFDFIISVILLIIAMIFFIDNKYATISFKFINTMLIILYIGIFSFRTYYVEFYLSEKRTNLFMQEHYGNFKEKENEISKNIMKSIIKDTIESENKRSFTNEYYKYKLNQIEQNPMKSYKQKENSKYIIKDYNMYKLEKLKKTYPNFMSTYFYK